MLKKKELFLLAIILAGFSDWITSVAGIYFSGASELNPVLSGLAQSSALFFSVAKLSAVVFVGLIFYAALSICARDGRDWVITKRFLYGGCSLSFLALTFVAASNMLIILRI